jgi:hypothetical protein
MSVDWSDPCARAAALTAAYFNLLQGSGETLIRIKGPEGEQEVRYHSPDLGKLKTEMVAAQAECAAATSGVNPNRRYAIRAGAKRRCLPPGYW